MYKGHSSRRQYLAWCQRQWDQNHPRERSAGNQTINDWVDGFTQEGAVGTCDLLQAGGGEHSGQQVIVFAHLLPATIDELAKAFADGLEVARQEGFVDFDRETDILTSQGKAPSGNTGLGSTEQVN